MTLDVSTQADLAKLGVREFAERFRKEMIPLSNRYAYFSALPMAEDEIKEYLEEPIAALPPGLLGDFETVRLFLVPFLEQAPGKGGELVTFSRPEDRHLADSAQFVAGREAVLVLAVKDREVADYHYVFYRGIANVIADHASGDPVVEYSALLREELRNRVHGEIDERAWQLKQDVLRRQSDPRRDTKLFRNYARASFIDTLTLYLHGICCDIDVETGPRQIPSRYLRKRLELFHGLYPPPGGYAVFPEELKT